MMRGRRVGAPTWPRTHAPLTPPPPTHTSARCSIQQNTDRNTIQPLYFQGKEYICCELNPGGLKRAGLGRGDGCEGQDAAAALSYPLPSAPPSPPVAHPHPPTQMRSGLQALAGMDHLRLVCLCPGPGCNLAHLCPRLHATLHRGASHQAGAGAAVTQGARGTPRGAQRSSGPWRLSARQPPLHSCICPLLSNLAPCAPPPPLRPSLKPAHTHNPTQHCCCHHPPLAGA